MSKAQRTKLWFQRVILRGIEGIIGDKYLEQAIKGPVLGEGFSDYFEAKFMAEQVYAQCLGWGL